MQTVNIQGLSIVYRKEGNGSALVLLHGFAQDARIWNQQIAFLSKYFRVIAWDAPGAGQSGDPPGNFTISNWADCLATLLDAVNIHQAHILGLSWGGLLAQEFYHRHPARVLSLILVGTYAGWKGSLAGPKAKARLEDCFQNSVLPPGEFVLKYLPEMFSDAVNQETGAVLGKIMSGTHPEGFRLMATTLAIADTRALLPHIDVPVLLIWGESDKRSPLHIAHQMHRAIPGARIEIIIGAGHVCNMEQPEQFNKIVSEFCASV